MQDLSFYHGKKVLVTGHTGFKGAWLSIILKKLGAEVIGYSLQPPTSPSLFEIANVEQGMISVIGDIRDYSFLLDTVSKYRPEILFHLAAQPLVRDSYKNPRYTYETNVMGTVNILEVIRVSPFIKSVIIVTTDKVYENKEWIWGYRESDSLNGYDPYSNSKSCAELVTSSYRKAFFNNHEVAVSTVRAGNVIGGGDFAVDRIIPDCVKSAIQNRDIVVRNPHSTRPYQHVLEPLFAYLLLACKQYNNNEVSGSYNVGPNDSDCYTTGNLVSLFVKTWGHELKWINQHDGGPHEANFLRLDCSMFKSTFSWEPRWNLEKAVEKVVEWAKVYQSDGDINKCISNQIDEYLDDWRITCE